MISHFHGYDPIVASRIPASALNAATTSGSARQVVSSTKPASAIPTSLGLRTLVVHTGYKERPPKSDANRTTKVSQHDATALFGGAVAGIVDLDRLEREGKIREWLSPGRNAFHEILHFLQIAARPFFF